MIGEFPFRMTVAAVSAKRLKGEGETSKINCREGILPFHEHQESGRRLGADAAPHRAALL